MSRLYQLPHSAFLAWSKDDRDKAIWQYVRERQRCRGCGTRPAEWSAEQGGDRNAYVAAVDRCPGCEVLEIKRDNLDAKKMGAGIAVKLVRRRR